MFKRNILKIYRPMKKSLFNIHDPIGIKRIFQLRVGLSPLKKHKRSHNFQDTPVDTCNCKRSAETSEHFLFHCPFYTEQRRVLLQTLNPILLANDLRFLDDKSLLHLLLYGHEKFDYQTNQTILKATISFLLNLKLNLVRKHSDL